MAFRDDYAQGRPAGDVDGKAAPPSGKTEAAPPAGQAVPQAPPSARRKRPLRRLVLVALLLGGGGYGAYAGHEWWTTGRFFVSTDDAYVQADISTLAAKVSGYLEAVPVVNGQAVKAGDVIARIEDGDYRLALKAAEDKLATQGSTIARIARQAEAARAQVLQGQAQIDAAKADQVRAAADYQRQMQLAQSEFAAKSRLEQSRADRDRSDATVKGAEANLIARREETAAIRSQANTAKLLAESPTERPAWAAQKALRVSPCTSTASGWKASSTPSMPPSTLDVMPDNVCPGCIRFRSNSGTMPKSCKTWSSICRCCALTHTADVKPASACNAFTSGAILMASGRVPNTVKIFPVILLSPCHLHRLAIPKRDDERVASYAGIDLTIERRPCHASCLDLPWRCDAIARAPKPILLVTRIPR